MREFNTQAEWGVHPGNQSSQLLSPLRLHDQLVTTYSCFRPAFSHEPTQPTRIAFTMGPRGGRRRRDAAVTNHFFNQTAPQFLSGSATLSAPATGSATTTVSATAQPPTAAQVPAATTPPLAATADRDAFLAEIKKEKAMLREKIAMMDTEMERLQAEIAAGRKVKEDVKEEETAEKMKDVAAAGKKKKKRSKKRAVVPTGLGVSGFAPGENPHTGKFVFGKVEGWRGDLEWMMAIGMKD